MDPIDLDALERDADHDLIDGLPNEETPAGRPYPNEHSARLKDLGQYDLFRRDNDKFGAGIHAIWGIKKGPPRKSELQAIRFAKSKFTAAEAKAWLKDHDINYIAFEAASGKKEIDPELLAAIRARHPEDGAEIDVLEDGAVRVSLGIPVEVPASQSSYLLPIEVPDFEGDARTADLSELSDELEFSFSSEKPVLRFGVEEILSHDSGDCNFGRLKSLGAILKNHNPSEIVGRPTKVWLDDEQHKGRLRMNFGSTDVALQAKREALIDKSLRGVSVGYVIREELYLKDDSQSYKGRIRGNSKKGTWVVTKWEAYEASLTPIPADPSVGVGRTVQPKESPKMDPNEKVNTPADPSPDAKAEQKAREEAQQKAALEAASKAAVESERARVSHIRKMCERHTVDKAEVDKMINDGLDESAVNARILDLLEKQNEPLGRVEVALDDRTKYTRAATESILLRKRMITRDQCEHGGETLPPMSLLELARNCLMRAGIPIPSDVRRIAELALQGPKIGSEEVLAFQRGADAITGSSSDFPYLLANVAYKAVIDAYNSVVTTYEQWCKIGSVSDFKVNRRIKISEFGEMQLLAEGGKYRETHLSEDQNTIQVVTYALAFNMSRVALINDDLDMFTTVPARLARSGARLPNILAVTTLLANANLNDGIALFAAGHGNRNAETDYRLDTLAHGLAGIQAMIIGMQSQTQMMHAIDASRSSGITISIEPKILLTGQTGQFIARQVLFATHNPGQTGPGIPNPVERMFTPLVEPLLEDTNITGYSTTAYYGFADPNDAPVIEVAFLNGVREPYMEEADQTDADGRVWKIRHDVGAAAIDYVGAYLETGVDD